MTQYIPKYALVAEIERRRDLHYKYYMKNGAGSIAECKYDEDRYILSFLDTLEVKEIGVDFGDPKGSKSAIHIIDTKNLEVKEVDLEKEIKEEYLKRRCYGGRDNMLVILSEPQFNKIAKHFFELGMRVNNKAQKGE